MKIRIATENDKTYWNSYCKKQVNLAPLSRYDWKYVLEEAYNVNVFPIIALDEGGQICGIHPVYEIKDYSGHPNIYSLKFGLTADNTKIANNLFKYAQNLAKNRNASGMTISSGYNHYENIEHHTIAKTVTLDICPSEDEMWGNISGNARNMVRKAKKDGITVEQGLNNLEEFYSVYTDRMLQLGVRIHSIDYFKAIIRHMGGRAQLFIARKASEIVGGMFLTHSHDTAAYVYGGSLVRKGTSPSQIMLWEMIRFCIFQGIKNLDLGESVEGSGVYNFKVWFGGKPKDIHYYDYPLDSRSNSIFNKAYTLFRRQFLRFSSYCLLNYGPLGLKRKVGIWKRQKGNLQ